MIISSASMAGIVASLGVAALITLIAALVIKELAMSGGATSKVGRNLDVVILPLLFVFCFIVSVKVWEIVG